MMLVLLLAALAASSGGGAGAQAETPPTPAPAASPASTAEAEPEAGDAEPDLSITATVRFRELRFDSVGEPNVVFSGQPERRTVWHAERFNLPTPVEPGVTYRDGGVELTITSTFADLLKMYAEPGPEPPGSAAAPRPEPSPAEPEGEDPTTP